MNLCQYFTPAWAASLLLERHFPSLTSQDVVADLCCGDGRFLMAIPSHVQGYGVEIDPVAAQEARNNSGRLVITGNCLTVDLPQRPTVVITNPPFQLSLVEQLLKRCYEAMENGGRVGMILPVYMVQTSRTALRLFGKWSVDQELIPRDMFQGLENPLMFMNFQKSKTVQVSGFFLYTQTASLHSLRKEYKERFAGNGSRASVWKETIWAALKFLGGSGSLKQIYEVIENGRPTSNPFWREQIRKVAGKHFKRVDEGIYCLG